MSTHNVHFEKEKKRITSASLHTSFIISFTDLSSKPALIKWLFYDNYLQ